MGELKKRYYYDGELTVETINKVRMMVVYYDDCCVLVQENNKPKSKVLHQAASPKELNEVLAKVEKELLASGFHLDLDEADTPVEKGKFKSLILADINRLSGQKPTHTDSKRDKKREATAKKYKGKNINELGSLFFEIGNKQLVPELRVQITAAVKKFRELQVNDKNITEMIIVADFEENLFAFATGDGSGLSSGSDPCVFHIAQSEKFTDCMELIDYICFGNHPQGYLNLNSEVSHWVSDAMPKLAGLSATIYYGVGYGESEDDPVYEK